MKKLTLRLTDAEHEVLVKNAERAGLSSNQYLLTLLHQKSVFDELDRKQDARLHKLADTILAKLDMQQNGGNSSSGDTLTATEFRALNRMLIDAVTPLLIGTPQQAALNRIRDRIEAGTLLK